MLHASVYAPWEYDQEPFPIADHVYYVGSRWVGCFLLDTGDGLMLIDCGMPQTLYLLLDHIRALGFDPREIRNLLITHAHYDHAGAAESLRRYTGAKTWLGKEDLCFMGNPALKLSEGETFPDFTVDELYQDDTPIHQGRFEIRTVHTPGHTPGARSLFFNASADGKEVLCGMHGGLGFATMKNEFLNQNGLPRSLCEAFADGLEKLKEIPVTLAIGSHPKVVRMLEKHANRQEGINPFADPAVWPELMENTRNAFLKEHPELGRKSC